jgi:hypothetical protein
MKYYKIILSIFIICIAYILTVDAIFVDYPALNTAFFRLGKVVLTLAYSLTASCIFYFIAVYLPEKYLRRKFVSSMYRRTNLISDQVFALFYYLKIDPNTKDYDAVYKELEIKAETINPDEPLNEYTDWHEYLLYFKEDILSLISRITVYHTYLDQDFLNELTLLEDQLTNKIVFGGYKQLAIKNLTYASLTLHEIYVHNNLLQQINQRLYQRHKKMIDKDIARYHAKNYHRKTLNSY